MVNKTLVLLVIPPLVPLPLHAQVPIALETAGNFAVLAGSNVTNTGDSTVHGGDVGASHGFAVTGFPPGTVASPSTIRIADAATREAQAYLAVAYNAAEAMTPTHNLSGQDLGGLTLLPGVYSFSSSAQLTGMLTLNDQGDPNAKFLFQIGTTLTTAKDSSMISINPSTDADPKCTVYWQVGGSATLGHDSTFEGNIMALENITMNTDATIHEGSALARNGSVTLDSNKISKTLRPLP